MSLPVIVPAATTPPQCVLGSELRWPLHEVAASRTHEAAALAAHAPGLLMERAGLAVARLARAIAPHAQDAWLACGPGNNGGDGLVAARHLHRAGLATQVTWFGDENRLSADSRAALQAAQQAGVAISSQWPDSDGTLAIDALLGLGGDRPLQGAMAQAAQRINDQFTVRLAVDLPSGLNANTGSLNGKVVVRATHTLALMTLKPGLFTAEGRDHAGDVWFDTLGIDPLHTPTPLRLASRADLLAIYPPRRHASHKGRFGDVAIVGGAPGMTGAALLAARAALAAGAGRVLLHLLDEAAPRLDITRPELMFRDERWLLDAQALSSTTVVCGCGGGDAVRRHLPALLARCPRLVLDADALNALAADEQLAAQLLARAVRGLHTLLTPHPLEAARLLGSTAAQVQADRLQAARELAHRFGCTALLKGSGSITATAGGECVINTSGNGSLASGGTGDVLAGWAGGCWAQIASRGAPAALAAAVATTWLHGHAADRACASRRMPSQRAAELIEWMRRSLP